MILQCTSSHVRRYWYLELPTSRMSPIEAGDRGLRRVSRNDARCVLKMSRALCLDRNLSAQLSARNSRHGLVAYPHVCAGCHGRGVTPTMMDPSGRNPQTPKKPGGGQQPGQPQSRFRLPRLAPVGAAGDARGWYIYMFLWPQEDPRSRDHLFVRSIAASREWQVKQVEITGQKVDGEFTEELRWTGDRPAAPRVRQIPADVDPDDIETGTEFSDDDPGERAGDRSSHSWKKPVSGSRRSESGSRFCRHC